MALRPVALIALLTFALVAGCSDGPPSGDLVAKPGAIDISGATSENTYTPRSGGQENPIPGQDRVCPTDPTGTVPPCVEASSNYKVHFMSLPEPDGNGYAVFQVGGEIGERQLVPLTPTPEGMYEAEFTRDGVDESAMFERLELRMGSFVVASASSAQGSQAFVADAAFGNVTVTGSFKGHTLSLDVKGLPGDGSKPQFVGRLYTLNQAGNLTVAESFNVVNGAQEYVSKDANVGDYAEFHIHVGTSKVYVYQATLGEP
jgi:hypothetical protein